MSQSSEAAIVSYLRGRKMPFTMGDLMSQTGHSKFDLDEGLKAVMKKYDCAIQASEEGDLLYDFGAKLVRRDRIPLSERIHKLGKIFWAWFSVAYKASLAIVLMVYFIIFVVVLVVLVVAMMSAQGQSNNRSRSSPNIGGIISRMFFSIFEFWTHSRMIYRPLDPFGYRYRHYDPRQTNLPHRSRKGSNLSEKEKHSKDKSFIASVYDFALGPPRVPLDPLANQKEFASYLRASKGVATTSEVQALAGWKTEKASKFLTSSIVAFDGSAEITDDGTFYGRFENLIRGTEREEQTPVVYFWDEYVPEYELTGNTKSRNLLIMFMNGFNLVFSYLFLSGQLNQLLPVEGASFFWLAWFPFGFSISLFLLPILRWFWVRRMQTLQHIENIRRRLMKALFDEPSESFTIEGLTSHANEHRTTEEILSAKRVQNIVKDMVFDLEGDSSVSEGVSEDATIEFRFDRVKNELNDITHVRQHLLPQTSTGAPVALLE